MARRQSYWDTTLVDSTLNDASQLIVDLSGTPGGLPEGFTAVRTIMDLWLFKNAGPTADAIQRVDLGIGLVSEDAFSVSAVPDPNVATDRPVRDWLWRTRCMVVQDASQMIPPTRCAGDFRGQRKLGGGTMALIGNSDVVVGSGFQIRVSGIIRLLVLRP